MAGLSRTQEIAIERLIATSPDALLSRLGAVLASAGSERFHAVANRVGEERAERRARAAVFGPVLNMARPGGPTAGPRFPLALLAEAWRRAARMEPELAVLAATDDASEAVLNRLALTIAGVLRDQAGGLTQDDSGETARELAHFVDLIPLIRPIAPLAAEWILSMDEAGVARLRLVLQDAARIMPDGDVRVLEILAAGFDEPVAVLRIIARTMGPGGSERLLAQSELAAFGDRAVDAIGAAVERMEALNARDITLRQIDRLSQDLDLCGRVLVDLTTSIDMCEGEAWSRRILAYARRLNQVVEGLLAACERAIDKALPMRRARIAGRMTRLAPALDAPLDRHDVEQARALASLLSATRSAAPLFGFTSRRSVVLTATSDRLAGYIDEALSMLGGGEARDPRNAARLIQLAIDLLSDVGEARTAGAFSRRLTLLGQAPSQAVG